MKVRFGNGECQPESNWLWGRKKNRKGDSKYFPDVLNKARVTDKVEHTQVSKTK